MAAQSITAEELNDMMELYSVIEVHEDGTVTRADNEYAPELYLEVDGDGQTYNDSDESLKADAERAGWELLTGYSGQQGYNGPVMHESEYVGGRMAADILETPGIYVAVPVDILPLFEDCDTEPAGWALAKKIA